jgi:hypothetical protein
VSFYLRFIFYYQIILMVKAIHSFCISYLSIVVLCQCELNNDWINYHLLNFIFQGKFIRINFDVTGYIVGANIETCILPKYKWFTPLPSTWTLLWSCKHMSSYFILMSLQYFISVYLYIIYTKMNECR